MIDTSPFPAKDEKEFYVEVKFIKYGTYTFHATSKEHAMQSIMMVVGVTTMRSMIAMMKKSQRLRKNRLPNLCSYHCQESYEH